MRLPQRIVYFQSALFRMKRQLELFVIQADGGKGFCLSLELGMASLLK